MNNLFNEVFEGMFTFIFPGGNRSDAKYHEQTTNCPNPAVHHSVNGNKSAMRMSKKTDRKHLISLLEKTTREVEFAQKGIDIDQALANCGSAFFELLDSLKNIEHDQDNRQKLEVYQNISSFLIDNFAEKESDYELCIIATLIMCDERRLRSEFSQTQAANQLAAKAESFLISIRVHYSNSSQYRCRRVTEIFFVSSGKKMPVRHQVEEDISWDSLPAQIRSIFIKEKKEIISFQLYPSKKISE